MTRVESLVGHHCSAASVILGWASCGSAGGKEVCQAPSGVTITAGPLFAVPKNHDHTVLAVRLILDPRLCPR